MTTLKNALVCLNHKEGEEIIFSNLEDRCPNCKSTHYWPLEKWLSKERAAA